MSLLVSAKNPKRCSMATFLCQVAFWRSRTLQIWNVLWPHWCVLPYVHKNFTKQKILQNLAKFGRMPIFEKLFLWDSKFQILNLVSGAKHKKFEHEMQHNLTHCNTVFHCLVDLKTWHATVSCSWASGLFHSIHPLSSLHIHSIDQPGFFCCSMRVRKRQARIPESTAGRSDRWK